MSHDETQEVESQVVDLLLRCVRSSTSTERHAAEVKLLVHIGLARATSLGRLAARLLSVLNRRELQVESVEIPADARQLSLASLADWAFPKTRYPEWLWAALAKHLRDPKLAVAAALAIRIQGDAAAPVLADLGEMEGISPLAQEVLRLRGPETPYDETRSFIL